jgi:hypothetical protein
MSFTRCEKIEREAAIEGELNYPLGIAFREFLRQLSPTFRGMGHCPAIFRLQQQDVPELRESRLASHVPCVICTHAA